MAVPTRRQRELAHSGSGPSESWDVRKLTKLPKNRRDAEHRTTYTSVPYNRTRGRKQEAEEFFAADGRGRVAAEICACATAGYPASGSASASTATGKTPAEPVAPDDRFATEGTAVTEQRVVLRYVVSSWFKADYFPRRHDVRRGYLGHRTVSDGCPRL